MCHDIELVHAESATVVYLSVLDIHADTVEAMSEVAAMLVVQRVHSHHRSSTPSCSW